MFCYPKSFSSSVITNNESVVSRHYMETTNQPLNLHASHTPQTIGESLVIIQGVNSQRILLKNYCRQWSSQMSVAYENQDMGAKSAQEDVLSCIRLRLVKLRFNFTCVLKVS